MGDLITAPIALQIAKVATAIVFNLGKGGAVTLIREGVDAHVLGQLTAALQWLIPRANLDRALETAGPLELVHSTRFLAQVMAPRIPTTQHLLMNHSAGRSLILFSSALSCVSPSPYILALFREITALSFDISEVAPIAEGILKACVHAGTAASMRSAVTDELDWFYVAFSNATHLYRSEEARESYRVKDLKPRTRDLAALLLAFGKAQQANRESGIVGEEAYVLVRNFEGFEAMCASLSVVFGARVKVGLFQHRPTAAFTDGIPPTSLVFEYSYKQPQSISVCRRGKPISAYVAPVESPRPTPAETMTVAHLSALAKSHLCQVARMVRIAAGVNRLGDMAKHLDELVRPRQQPANTANTMEEIMATNWLAAFEREMDIPIDTGEETQPPESESLDADIRSLVELKAKCGNGQHDFWDSARDLCGHPVVDTAEYHNNMDHEAQDIWIVSFLDVMFGPHKTTLVIDRRAYGHFRMPKTIEDMISAVLNLLSAYKDFPFMSDRERHVQCSAVQCGSFALLPRMLAEEQICASDSSMMVMLPGRLSMNDVHVPGFYYEYPYVYSIHDKVKDTRESVRLPTDWSASNNIEYHYLKAEWAYTFWTTEAEHRLQLDSLLDGLMTAHIIDSFDTTAPADSWTQAAPHHYSGHSSEDKAQKIIYNCHGNNAGRRLALSNARRASVVYRGKDYREALAYADAHDISIVIT